MRQRAPKSWTNNADALRAAGETPLPWKAELLRRGSAYPQLVKALRDSLLTIRQCTAEEHASTEAAYALLLALGEAE